MTPLDWAVMAAGIAAIAWVNWYFFLAERTRTPSRTSKGMGGGPRGRSGESDDANDPVEASN